MAPPDHAWLRALDLAFVDRRFGRDTVDRLLGEERAYSQVPRVDLASRLHAGSAHPFVVRVVDGREVQVSGSCARGGQYLCDHVVGLLVDLAVHAPLREALAAGEPADALLLDLAAVRSERFHDRTLDQRLAVWLPPRADDDFAIEVEPARASGHGVDERPTVLVRVRRTSSRGWLAPREVLAARLSARWRRLVELTSPSALHRDALVATRAQASLLLHLLREERAARLRGGARPLRFSPETVAPRLHAEGSSLVARWHLADGRALCESADAVLFAGPFPYLWSESHEVFHPVAPDVDLDFAAGLASIPSLPLTPSTAGRVGRALLARGRGLGVVLPAPEVFGLPPLEAPGFVLRVDGSPLDVRAELAAVYAGATVPVLAREGSVADRAAHLRDRGAEEAAVALLRAAGLVERDDGAFGASEGGAVAFWERGLPILRESAVPRIDVLLAEPLARVKVAAPVRAHVQVGVESGWLEMDLDFTASSLKVEMAALDAALVAKRRWVTLSDGTLARITEEIAELVSEAGPLLRSDGTHRLAPFHLGRVERWLARFGGEADERTTAAMRDLRALAVPPEPDLPAGLHGTLRPYQRQGLAWLQWLRALGVGGVLADDMGLGKTVTTLALLARWREDEGAAPSLVVCPTSVIGNWMAEARRFVPDVRVRAIRGTADLREAIDGDVVVTSYGMLRRHTGKLESAPWRAVILDEAQNVKNAGSEVARAARRLRARMRLALTGTPIENRLSELWSLLDFANPGMLGTAAEFDDRYERPIAMRPDGPSAEHLRAIVRPFVLRRTKASVLSELPAKTLVERACVLGTKEKRSYDALARTLRRAVRRHVEKRGFTRSHLSVLTAILRLRQMACDPRLVDPSLDAGPSAKRKAFLRVVRELVAEGRRALVFSQFVELFTLWRDDLDDEGIAYEYLDGGTVDRDAVVERFRRGSAPLFLLSLKAGGAGLNLTEADTVIHCDPWWNPAVEDQATDRAHRMGQRRAVTVIRLVAQGTIEEKVALLKKQKRELAGAILGAGEDVAPALTGLTEEDVARLLGDVGGGEGPAPVPAAPVLPELEARNATVRELDELRSMVRWLDQTGVPAKELARQVGVPASQLSLVLVGHRVRVARAAAARIRELYEARRALWR